jgi:hypothetical protein
MREALQIQGEASPSGTAVEPGRKFVHVLRRELVIPRVPGKLDDRGGAESAVKVIVQEDFGDRLKDVVRDFHARRRKSGASGKIMVTTNPFKINALLTLRRIVYI